MEFQVGMVVIVVGKARYGSANESHIGELATVLTASQRNLLVGFHKPQGMSHGGGRGKVAPEHQHFQDNRRCWNLDPDEVIIADNEE